MGLCQYTSHSENHSTECESNTVLSVVNETIQLTVEELIGSTVVFNLFLCPSNKKREGKMLNTLI